jgi:hypothetical protein
MKLAFSEAKNKIELQIPVKIYRLDDKAQRRANSGDILVHDLFDDGCLARIVETTALLFSGVDRKFL